jgi:hypothetical protein
MSCIEVHVFDICARAKVLCDGNGKVCQVRCLVCEQHK